jgi:C4-type Zn-finger protein
VSHKETIICPSCEREQVATVEHTWPWYSCVHICNECGYTIMESEWERVDK